MYFHEIRPKFAEDYHDVIDGVVVAYLKDRQEIDRTRAILNDVAPPASSEFSYPWNVRSQAGDFGMAQQSAKVLPATRYEIRFLHAMILRGRRPVTTLSNCSSTERSCGKRMWRAVRRPGARSQSTEATVASRAVSPSSSVQPDAGARPRDGEVLALDDVAVRFGGISALVRVSLGARRDRARPDRPERRGQDHALRRHLRHPHAERGQVSFRGRDATTASAVARSRQGLRRTFQRVQTFGWLTVEDNVLAALEWRGGGGGMFADVVRLPTRRRTRTRPPGPRQRGARAVRAHRGASDPVGSLPIGLARMVEFARAIVDEPKLLLLDEPTSGLDEREAERLIEQLAVLRATTTCSVMLVEHDMGFVMEQCETVVVLELGQVIATGTPREIQENPQVRAAYLGDGSNNRNHGNNEHQGGQS